MKLFLKPSLHYNFFLTLCINLFKADWNNQNIIISQIIITKQQSEILMTTTIVFFLSLLCSRKNSLIFSEQSTSFIKIHPKKIKSNHLHSHYVLEKRKLSRRKIKFIGHNNSRLAESAFNLRSSNVPFIFIYCVTLKLNLF